MAEVAFFTDDLHAGRGMATVLLEYLAARPGRSGITGFTAQVLPTNRRMLGVFKQVGFEVTSRFSDGVIEVEFPIEPTEEADGQDGSSGPAWPRPGPSPGSWPPARSR